MIFDTNGISYDKIAMGKWWRGLFPIKENQIAKTKNKLIDLFRMEASYLITTKDLTTKNML